MKPLVSILIPAYNAEAYISDTLRSAIAQTWENKEIIVVDDGSKDKTFAVARQFESDRVKVVTQRNQGASATRNHAFSLSQGDYVQWLDADDLMAPEKTSTQIEAAERSGSKRTLISGAWAHFMHRPYRAEFLPSPLWEDLQPAEWMTRKMELNIYMQTATWLVSRELAEAAGPWDTRLLGDDDGEFFDRVLLASNGTRFVKESRVYYRQSGASIRSASISFGRRRSSPKVLAANSRFPRSLGNIPGSIQFSAGPWPSARKSRYPCSSGRPSSVGMKRYLAFRTETSPTAWEDNGRIANLSP